MTDDDVQPIIIAGLPGIRYEACWGRKTLKATTLIGRVYEWVEGGGMELWHCDHQHPSKATAQDCALDWAEQHAARRQATAPDPAADLAANARVHRGHHRPAHRVPVTTAARPTRHGAAHRAADTIITRG